jgi:hypothetical protein
MRKPRLARGERHVRSRVAYSAPPPAGSPTVAPAPQVTPAAIETEGTSGPSLALLIAAITALGAVAVLILVVRNDRLPAA